MKKTILLSIALTGLLAACGKTEPPAESSATKAKAENASDAPFVIEDAYVRAPLQGSAATAAYMTVKSNSDQPAFIVSVTSPQAEKIELHTNSMEDGMMNMQQVDFIDLMPGESAILRPMGNHLMVFGLDPALKAGDSIDLTIVISVNGEPIVLEADAPIQAIG